MSVVTQETDISIIRTVENERIIVRSLPAPGPPGPSGNVFPASIKTELQLDPLYPGNHKEIVYDSTEEMVLSVKTWDSPAKTILLFQKTFQYDLAGKITSVTKTSVVDGKTIVTTLTYDINNKIVSVDRVYTP